MSRMNLKLCNSRRKSRINIKFSTETHNNDLQNMLNDQLYKFWNLDFRILMTSHENDPYDAEISNLHVCACASRVYNLNPVC